MLLRQQPQNTLLDLSVDLAHDRYSLPFGIGQRSIISLESGNVSTFIAASRGN
jgi:hypothetical protein